MMACGASASGRVSQEPAHKTRWPRAVGRYAAKSSQDANIWHDDEDDEDEDEEDVSLLDESRRVDGAGNVEHRSAVESSGKSPANAGGMVVAVVRRTTNAAALAVTANKCRIFILVRPIVWLR